MLNCGNLSSCTYCKKLVRRGEVIELYDRHRAQHDRIVLAVFLQSSWALRKLKTESLLSCPIRHLLSVHLYYLQNLMAVNLFFL